MRPAAARTLVWLLASIPAIDALYRVYDFLGSNENELGIVIPADFFRVCALFAPFGLALGKRWPERFMLWYFGVGFWSLLAFSLVSFAITGTLSFTVNGERVSTLATSAWVLSFLIISGLAWFMLCSRSVKTALDELARNENC